MGCVYQVRNKSNGKLYIGLTSSALEKRWYWHVRASRAENPRQLLAKAIKKHGPDMFELSVLEECDSYESLREREKHWISVLGSFVTCGGYNMTLGGDGVLGYKHTDTAKHSMSEKRKGSMNHNFGKVWGFKWDEDAKSRLSEVRKGEGNPMFGKHQSDEARQKITEANKKSVVMLDSSSLEELRTFASMQEAAAVCNCKPQGISRACRFPSRTAAGFKWSYQKCEGE